MAKIGPEKRPTTPGGGRDAIARTAVWIVTSIILAYGLLRVIGDRWVCDDAFISFRYAKNLLAGHGLVYNVGEAVEGYSNFLWTLVIAAGMRLGADPVPLSETLGVVCYAATILLLVRTALRATAGARARLTMPLAAAALSLHSHVRIFATGGLETSLFTLEMTALVVLLTEAVRWRDYLLVGLVGVAAALTRPDGALFYALAGAVAACDSVRERRWRPLLGVLLPAAVLYLPYFLWRLQYYGHLFPNTFYAKGAGRLYMSQGLLYVALYLRCYYVLALALLALPTLLAVRWRATAEAPGRGRAAWSGLRAAGVILLFVAGNFFFAVWSGGDFMFARFLIPATPLLYLGAELLVRGIVSLRWRFVCAAAALVATVVIWYPSEITDLFNATGVVEERSFYPRERLEEARRLGEHLKDLTAETEPHVVIFGMQAMLAYYAEFPLVIEAAAGLTDSYIAHLPTVGRTRTGHRKTPPVEYLRDRGVDFKFEWPRPMKDVGFAPIDFGVVTGELVTYRRGVMDHLKGKPGVRFWDFQAYLRALVRTLPDMPPEDVREQYAFWKSVYFQHNDDPELEAAFIDALARDERRPSAPSPGAPRANGDPPDRG